MLLSENSKPRLIAIVGPTGSGKSSLALKLAHHFQAEIISVDSLQIYRHMDIGTGKILLEEREGIPHHLLDIVDPDEDFDASCFQEAADKIISRLHQAQKPVILAGGTGLYLRALLHGIFKTPADAEIREKLNQQIEQDGLASLYRKLQEVDPESLQKISPRDKIRIIRALEIHELTGKPFSAMARAHGHQENRYEALLIGLSPDRKLLYERINRRVEEMLEMGWISELLHLRRMGFSPQLKPMACIGYRELNQMLDGTLAPEETVDKIKKFTRRYAKRQLTWFRKEPVRWYESSQDANEDQELIPMLESFLSHQKKPANWQKEVPSTEKKEQKRRY